MTRNHIHFAPGEPGADGVISGMRKSCQIYIYVDMKAAMNAGYKFYLSSNNVILCPGNQDGLLPIQFISRVMQIQKHGDKKQLYPIV